MTTIKQIKNTLNIQDLRNNQDELVRDILSDKDLLELGVQDLIKNYFDNNTQLDSGSIRYTKRTIEKESLIQLLRDVYSNTKNSFVKQVIISVGKSKEYSDKQIDVICEEISKINQLEINL